MSDMHFISVSKYFCAPTDAPKKFSPQMLHTHVSRGEYLKPIFE